MKLLAKALQLTQNPVTLDTLIEHDSLCQQAKGTEAERIADLYETLLDLAPDEVYEQWMDKMAQEVADGGR